MFYLRSMTFRVGIQRNSYVVFLEKLCVASCNDFFLSKQHIYVLFTVDDF
jgi:hypothetical protein